MSKTVQSFLVIFGLAFLFSACSNSNFLEKKWQRSVASNYKNFEESEITEKKVAPQYLNELKTQSDEKGQRLEFPPGLNVRDSEIVWHLAEGSEIYPTLWLLNLKSFLSNQKGSLFFKDLDKKFNVIKNPYAQTDYSPYSWIGLTATWDGDDFLTQDLLREENRDFKNLVKTKKLKSGEDSIAMTGANCAFCHTGSVVENGEVKVIDGAPAMVEMKGFFYDIIGSTYQTMFSEKELIAFYQRLGVKNAEQLASRLVRDLKRELAVEDTVLTEAIALLMKTPFLGKKIEKSLNTKAGVLLYEKRDVMTKYLVRMLKETYDLKTISNVQQKRMEYLTWFGAPNPDVLATPEGYGRTDAFGRISNATIRQRSYTHLTAPVSLPPMYGMKYKAFYHYNGNTNSLVARNIGQSFGLGSIVTGTVNDDAKKLDSTTNVPNLYEMEGKIYKIPIPEYTRYFSEKKINQDLIVSGCTVYYQKCATCHEVNDRIGPMNVLIDHQMIDQDIIKTDSEYTKNISKSALGKPFKKAIFDFTDDVKAGFYSLYEITPSMQKEYAGELMRGKEIFRDTFLGENRFAENEDVAYANILPGKSFAARHLAGVWATAPYLHNGSVLNIHELLLPANKRSKKFIVGNLQYDHEKLGFVGNLESHPEYAQKAKWGKKICQDLNDFRCFDVKIIGNSNSGHEPSMYGGELKNTEKLALIEFLKVLVPEKEYSWTSTPLYKVETTGCQLR